MQLLAAVRTGCFESSSTVLFYQINMTFVFIMTNSGFYVIGFIFTDIRANFVNFYIMDFKSCPKASAFGKESL